MENKVQPLFDVDEYGFPIPGKVIRYYRRQMKYLDPVSGKEKYWTQADLAKRLGLKEIMVTLMETQNKGLDSIERRRTLATLLHIPPALLGLASLDQLMQTMANSQLETMVAPIVLRKADENDNRLDLYKNAFNLYNSVQSTSTAQHSVGDMERMISTIEKDIRENTPRRNELLYMLWEFHRLVVKVQSHDICDWNRVSRHLNEELRIARELNDINLQVLTLNQSSEVHMFRQNIDLARIDIDAALIQARHASPMICSLVFANAARTRARSARDLSDKMSVNKFLDQAHSAAQRASISDERYIPAYVETVKCLFTQFDAYIAIGKIARAMEILDEIEAGIPPGNIRRVASLNLSRANCYTALKNPEYETALAFLQDTFQVYRDVKTVHGMEVLEKAYRSIASSPYGNAPEVVDLGIALREVKLKK